MNRCVVPSARKTPRVLLVLAMLAGLLASGVLVWQSSRAAFTASTTNPANTWAAGTVTLSDDDSGAAQFSAAGIAPGQSQTHCITVTYGGSVQSAVTLYATASTGALRPYLNLTVEEGSGGGFGSCTGFVSNSIDYAGTLADFASTRTDFATGAGFFSPTEPGEKTTYRFTTTLDPAAPNTVQGYTATAALQWQARSATATPMLATGLNSSRQLGLGDSTNRSTLTPVGTATTWRTVAASPYSSCATRANGTLWCWGRNGSGELGLGDTNARTTPTQVGTDTTWASVTAGDGHTCATRTDGTLWCWGNNGYGRLGLGDTTNRIIPTQVGTDANWANVTAGGYHVCATRTDGTLWCWGSNGFGQLGLGDSTNRTSPVQVGAATTWSNVATGFYHSCATRSDGTLWCWGYNYDGELGIGTSDYSRPSPVQVGTDTTWRIISGQGYGTCALRLNGTLWCWGANANGRLGLGDTTARNAPAQIGTATTWASVTGGINHACALRTDRSLWCWGRNDQGQLGLGDTTDRNAPTIIPGVTARSLDHGLGDYSFVLPWPS